MTTSPILRRTLSDRCFTTTLRLILHNRLQLRYVYALNLSILISAGKESNSDSPSTGEGRGKRPNLKSAAFHGTPSNCSYSRSPIEKWSGFRGSHLERCAQEGESPVPEVETPSRGCSSKESGCLKMQPQVRRWDSPKPEYKLGNR